MCGFVVSSILLLNQFLLGSRDLYFVRQLAMVPKAQCVSSETAAFDFLECTLLLMRSISICWLRQRRFVSFRTIPSNLIWQSFCGPYHNGPRHMGHSFGPDKTADVVFEMLRRLIKRNLNECVGYLWEIILNIQLWSLFHFCENRFPLISVLPFEFFCGHHGRPQLSKWPNTM